MKQEILEEDKDPDELDLSVERTFYCYERFPRFI